MRKSIIYVASIVIGLLISVFVLSFMFGDFHLNLTSKAFVRLQDKERGPDEGFLMAFCDKNGNSLLIRWDQLQEFTAIQNCSPAVGPEPIEISESNSMSGTVYKISFLPTENTDKNTEVEIEKLENDILKRKYKYTVLSNASVVPYSIEYFNTDR